MKTLTKADRRRAQLDRHYKAIETLAILCGVVLPNGRKLSVKLLHLENKAKEITMHYCNGTGGVTTANVSEKTDPIKAEILRLFNNNLQGFFINTDARGYALKIKTELMQPGGKYENTGLQTDWGGYGLLAPEITGN